MPKQIKSTIQAKGVEIALISAPNQADYISLTDIAKYKSDSPADVVKNWLRSRETIEYLGTWEQLNNPDFKLVEFDQFRIEAGRNAFVMSPKKWIDQTGAAGIISKSGRYGGTLAHVDIALEFASWISPEFKLYLIKDYQRLKSDEGHRHAVEWTARRALTKINYRLHTDAVKRHLVLPKLSQQQINYIYANEADILNIVLFGMTAQEWRAKYPDASGNIRDHATIIELLVLANLENINSELIQQGYSQSKRIQYLRATAIRQIQMFINDPAVKRLEGESNDKKQITMEE